MRHPDVRLFAIPLAGDKLEAVCVSLRRFMLFDLLHCAGIDILIKQFLRRVPPLAVGYVARKLPPIYPGCKCKCLAPVETFRWATEVERGGLRTCVNVAGN